MKFSLFFEVIRELLRREKPLVVTVRVALPFVDRIIDVINARPLLAPRLLLQDFPNPFLIWLLRFHPAAIVADYIFMVKI